MTKQEIVNQNQKNKKYIIYSFPRRGNLARITIKKLFPSCEIKEVGYQEVFIIELDNTVQNFIDKIKKVKYVSRVYPIYKEVQIKNLNDIIKEIRIIKKNYNEIFLVEVKARSEKIKSNKLKNKILLILKPKIDKKNYTKILRIEIINDTCFICIFSESEFFWKKLHEKEDIRLEKIKKEILKRFNIKVNKLVILNETEISNLKKGVYLIKLSSTSVESIYSLFLKLYENYKQHVYYFGRINYCKENERILILK